MSTKLTEALRKQIDSHGHSFQLSLAAHLREESLQRNIFFRIEAEEVAVEAGDKPTHIDFVMSNFAHTCWLVCECKRSDPAISNWCFARMSVVDRLGPTDVVAEVVKRFPTHGGIRSRGTLVATHPEQYDIAHELRSDQVGDSGSGRGALADALTQCVRHLNGYIRLLARDPSILKDAQVATIVPVVFTTANLWATSDDLSKASLIDGRLSAQPSELQQKDWICYRFRQSTALRHEHGQSEPANRLADLVQRDSIRTVFVVRAEACTSFFEWARAGISASWPQGA